MGRRHLQYRWLQVGLMLLAFALTWLPISIDSLQPIYGASPSPDFSDFANYPLLQTADAGYLPVADWSGRLILPEQAAAEADEDDWVWMEIFTSPQPELIGRRVRLQWQDNLANRAFLNLVTQSIEFDEAAIASIKQGRIHPTRLNGWSKVGPLQSLAGTRPHDDMIVALPTPAVKVQAEISVIEIDAVPIQIPERFYGLVRILGPDTTRPAPEDCPNGPPCPSDYVRVQHYQAQTRTFGGTIETVRIPQVPADANGIFQSTPQGLNDSPAGEAGWYIYGAKNTENTFVVRAIAPRRLFQLQPQTIITGKDAALNYINFGNWRHTPARKGTLQSVLLRSENAPNTLANWKEGDQMLAIHLFGGIGGERAEARSVPGTVTGHYAYGVGEVIREPLAQELQLREIYDQVYSHNPLGIVAGKTLWAEFTGNLQRGWLGVRPISDVLVKIPALSHTYRFGDITLKPFVEFQRELVVMMARYRTGDGTGASIVTPAQSCVQDSSQALYETIQVIKNRVTTNPNVQAWLADHPNDPQTILFQDLTDLGQRLQKELVPLGIVRPDWHENAEVLVGIKARSFGNVTTLMNNLLSWRTVIPRVAYDNVAAILLNHGTEMWFLRTNQIGGDDPTLLPLAPTELFGEYVVIPTAFSRFIEALRWPRWSDIGVVTLGLGGFAIALFLGLYAAEFVPKLRQGITALSAQSLIGTFFTPALWQECVFRVLLLPHPTEAVRLPTALIWALVSLGLYTAFHWWRQRLAERLAANEERSWYWYRTLVFGLLAMVVYFSTGSLWAIASFHWMTLWLEPAIMRKFEAKVTKQPYL